MMTDTNTKLSRVIAAAVLSNGATERAIDDLVASHQHGASPAPIPSASGSQAVQRPVETATSREAQLNASIDRTLAKMGLAPVEHAAGHRAGTAQGADAAAQGEPAVDDKDDHGARLNASIDRTLAKMGLAPVGRK